ncbi:2-polyprenyl-3-methyl-6-methoxy-1,4-benzoquinone monooxygenase [Methylophilus medardicus]|uniref:3-demethoxyubiquinol 3-hydroxylase n=1 Tax=Methylophilus medardicus TaxID=2588534 RepID=A0A5B8CUE5_9PROT|nr:2-polyprenyl-3-methyl-6-methoxy-1,4-benzoquinone monooxygenase [Methylophilus medardicus]QDC44869.1 2-polyprenyl-3-methyl-6-methoxy-1,4-benzoquinone monooxygenase [Methylophilus medardicus]QDC49876.1 2-polyprenyl-3-methyl-6-methoxy-1,4-benzoquinone monooxygenase [Methylophilus medardicus]QDC53581.1 2-polyprenyl-3-methyl-6-methoxy-1,4-benzoquinone monooxygenase [Methylophilus medardicus]
MLTLPPLSLDKAIAVLDMGLRTVFSSAVASRPYPVSEMTSDSTLTDRERKHAAALMRVNHVGEVCAQALYSGQALVSRDPANVEALKQASHDEVDHLAWCEQRINELGGRKSLLNPLWFGASFGLGVAAGLLGDKWNLGFLAETEHQVSAHLQSHLQALPAQDHMSRTIVSQMKIDEQQHAKTAEQLGGAVLPAPVKRVMKLASTVMTRTAYHL